MKKPAALLSACLMAGLLTVPALAANEDTDTLVISPAPASDKLSVCIDGKDTDLQAAVFLPLRATAEGLGYTVTWANGTATVDTGLMHTDVTPGLDTYFFTTSLPDAVGMSAPTALGQPPYQVNNTMYVPAAFFSALDDRVTLSLSGGTLSLTRETGPDGLDQIPNPFRDCDTLAQANSLTGYDLTAPDAALGLSLEAVSVLPDQFIQVNYTGADNGICLRKGPGTGDISGDNNQYSVSRTVTLNGAAVTLQGWMEGIVRLATWTKDGYTFSVYADQGLTESDFTALFRAIH